MKLNGTMKARKGSTYMIVIGAVIFVSMFTALSGQILSQGITRLHAYSLQMRAYYLNHSAEEAAVAALTADDNQLICDGVARFSSAESYSDTMTHLSGAGDYLGSTSISVTRERYEYYGRMEDWAVIRTVTEIPNDSNPSQLLTYKGSVMVLISNPLVRIYDINPDNF